MARQAAGQRARIVEAELLQSRRSARGAGAGEFGENPAGLGLVPSARLEMRETERRAGHPARKPASLLVLSPRLVVPAERLERARQIRVGAVEPRVDLGRGLILANPILVASGTFGYGTEYADVVDVQRPGAICCTNSTNSAAP